MESGLAGLYLDKAEIKVIVWIKSDKELKSSQAAMDDIYYYMLNNDGNVDKRNSEA